MNEGVKVVDRRWWAQREAQPTDDAEARETWTPAKPTYVEELEQRLAEKDRLLQDYITQYKQASQEFEEARARLRKDVGREAERNRRALLLDLLQVIDNLDRAVDAARAKASDDSLVQGVEMVRRQFLATLEGYGVKRFEALGETFDPDRHDAVTVVPAKGPDEDGRVAGIIAPGYAIGDDVLRHASVAVARRSADSGLGSAD
jgi:molecular chaperone GrpE